MIIKKLGRIDSEQQIEPMHISAGIMGVLTNQVDWEDQGVDEIELPIFVDDRVIKLSVPISKKALKENDNEVLSLFVDEEFKLIDKKYHGLYLYKKNLFYVQTEMIDKYITEEAILTIKKMVLSEDAKIKKLKKEVELLERLSTQDFKNKRPIIPDEVKLFVFNRDQGKCVSCGSKENLQFDHIIPIAKGGSSSEENVQLLCQQCNLKKSDNLTI
jgi:nitrate reductase cytochrome c-type subunit